MDRIDGILSGELGLLLNFGARKVEVKRKVKESQRRDPFILSSCQKGLCSLLIRHRICEKVD